ncbi:MAG: hypothetical protein EBR81_12210, partial [Proteobacteria bacterium]|nr:hypothetical protein [Pseudomonadota bacterium]
RRITDIREFKLYDQPNLELGRDNDFSAGIGSLTSTAPCAVLVSLAFALVTRTPICRSKKSSKSSSKNRTPTTRRPLPKVAPEKGFGFDDESLSPHDRSPSS